LKIAVSLAIGALCAVPGFALACPSCAGNSDGGMGRVIALGAMILLPFVITGFVMHAIRSATPRG
jgi:hypothetical protein